jgi:hypothetical protein
MSPRHAMSLGTTRGLTRMPFFGHIAGVPVEEALASLGPLVLVTGGWCLAALRSRLGTRRRGIE